MAFVHNARTACPMAGRFLVCSCGNVHVLYVPYLAMCCHVPGHVHLCNAGKYGQRGQRGQHEQHEHHGQLGQLDISHPVISTVTRSVPSQIPVLPSVTLCPALCSAKYPHICQSTLRLCPVYSPFPGRALSHLHLLSHSMTGHVSHPVSGETPSHLLIDPVALPCVLPCVRPDTLTSANLPCDPVLCPALWPCAMLYHAPGQTPSHPLSHPMTCPMPFPVFNQTPSYLPCGPALCPAPCTNRHSHLRSAML